MSTKDKTRSKLMESMRKTKASANSTSETKSTKAAASSKPAASAPKKAPARKPAPRPAAGSGNYSSRGMVQGDSYQAGRRIWPD